VSSRSRSPYDVASPVRLFVCLSSKTPVYSTQAVEMIGIFLHYLVSWPSVDIHGKFYGDRLRQPLRRGGGLNAKGVAKYSDFGLIEGYILETMQDREVS